MLTKQSIKMEVTAAIAKDSGLADAIRVAVGFDPVWSKLDLLGYLQVWLAYKSLTLQSTDYTYNYYDTFLAVAKLPEATITTTKEA